MPRLDSEVWERARADFEVRGLSFSEIGRKYGVSQTAVWKQAKKVGWVEGKVDELIERKVAAEQEIAEIDEKKLELPKLQQHTFDDVVRERLYADGIRARFESALAVKGLQMLKNAATPDELEQLSRVSRNIRPAQPPSTTVTVNQTQAQGQKSMTPEEVCAELIAAQNAEVVVDG